MRTIERLGFDLFWLGDHPRGGPDCWTTLAALAVRTERVRLGPLVSCVYYRSAGLLASQATDVDRLSGGRLVLGLGAGDIPHEFAQLGLAYPPFPARAAALAETVALVRGLWGEGARHAAGRLRAGGAGALGARPRAGAPRPAPDRRRRGADHAAAGGAARRHVQLRPERGRPGAPGTCPRCGASWPRWTRTAPALGRPPEAVLRSHFGSVLLAEAEAAVEAALAARPNRADMVEAPREPGLPRRLTSYYRLPSLEHVANIAVAGTPPQFVAYFRALIDAGMRYFVVGPEGDPETVRLTVRLLAEAVMPHLAVPARTPAAS